MIETLKSLTMKEFISDNFILHRKITNFLNKMKWNELKSFIFIGSKQRDRAWTFRPEMARVKVYGFPRQPPDYHMLTTGIYRACKILHRHLKILVKNRGNYIRICWFWVSLFIIGIWIECQTIEGPFSAREQNGPFNNTNTKATIQTRNTKVKRHWGKS